MDDESKVKTLAEPAESDESVRHGVTESDSRVSRHVSQGMWTGHSVTACHTYVTPERCELVAYYSCANKQEPVDCLLAVSSVRLTNSDTI